MNNIIELFNESVLNLYLINLKSKNVNNSLLCGLWQTETQ